MVIRTLAARGALPVREYGALFLLLLASMLLETAAAASVGALRDLMPVPLDPRLVGAAVYASLGVATLAAAYAAVRRLRDSADGLERHELVQIGGATALFLLVVGYVLHGAMDLPALPGDVVTSLLRGAVAMALPAFVYAEARGFDVRAGVPDPSAVFLAGATALSSALAGLGVIAVFAATADPLLVSLDRGVAPSSIPASVLLWRVVVPGALVGAGSGVLYHGAVQESLRECAGPPVAVAVVAALVGVTTWVSGEIGRTTAVATSATGAGSALTTAAAVLLVSLPAAFLVGRGVRRLPRVVDVEVTPLVAAAVAVLVVGVAVLGASVVRSYPEAFVANVVGLTVVAAAAGVGYERSRSVWVPAAGFASYLIVVDGDLALYLVRVLG
ncbi:hypothetical protein G9464_00065 [Halostella sp. JP-L12]|uniref:hypothetical protein n=1 Tax=Halostella TaxID=1843185 RepID=UPI000EF7841F|nr:MULTISPECIES: hypothetical protein [Halostella]NHN45990.1 hypothetical protein [Halostella sp. JP-L12]